MYVLPYSWAKKTQGQQRRQAARLKESAKQLLFWSGQWSSDFLFRDRRKFRYRFGETLGIGEFPSLDQSAPVYLYWPPGPFLATQYDKEPGGAGFEATRGPAITFGLKPNFVTRRAIFKRFFCLKACRK